MDFKKLLMEENIGGMDLTIRALTGVLGTLALATGLVKSSPWKWVIALIAATGLVTSITRHCSPYYLLGINTAKK